MYIDTFTCDAKLLTIAGKAECFRREIDKNEVKE